MKKRLHVPRLALCLTVAAILAGSGYAARQMKKYEVHDMSRPRPRTMQPPQEFGQAPEDAIILFDGKDKELSEWISDKRGSEIKWIVTDDYLEVEEKTGGIHTKRDFGNCQLHIEWRTPEVVKGNGQSRGNSGVFLMGVYELQILDNYRNETYADGQAGSIYGQYPPLVNVCREPGKWQSYDVIFMRPIFDDKGNVVREARITVLQNGVVVQNNVAIKGRTAHKKVARYRPHPEKGPIRLQDHGNPTRFRNIWIRELPEQPYLIKQN